MNAQRRPSNWVPLAIGAAGIIGALLLVLWWARHMMAQPLQSKREVAQIVQLVRPPPQDTPPPPPPEKIEQPLPQDQPDPDPTPDSAPEQLGLDAEGAAGSDAFGLAARRGGADLVGTGTAIFGHYTSLLKDAIQDRLAESERVRRGSYSVAVRVWIAHDGSVERAALVQGTGRHELDDAIELAARQARVPEAPPLEMPQPITLRIVSRG